MPYSVAERMCMVDLYLKGLTRTERRKTFCRLFPKADVPSSSTFFHWVKVWRERGSVQNKKQRPRDRSVLTDEKLADISELLKQNPRLSFRRLSAQMGISVTTAFHAKRILKLRSDEESAVNDLQVHDTQQNDFFGTISSELNVNEEEETDESGQDKSFSSVWVKVEKDDPDQEPVTEATSTCTEEDSALTCNLVQSSREPQENVQETSLHARENSLLGFKSSKSCTCNVCGRIFRNQHKMHKHMRKHSKIPTQEKPYACKFCNKAFVKKDCIIKHLRSHTGKRSDDCGSGDISFESKGDKKKHMALHKEKPIHVCKICGKSFVFKQHLNTHKKVHTEGKPYFCEICNKYFSRKKTMRKHLESHKTVNASEHSDMHCDDNYLQRQKRRMSSNEIDICDVGNDTASDSIIQMELIAQEYIHRQARKLLKENSVEIDSAQDSFNVASRNLLDEFYVGVEEHEFRESAEEREFSEVPLMVEKENNPLARPDRNPLPVASTNCSQDFTFTGISSELNVKVKEEIIDQPEEEMEFSEVRVKVEKEDCLPNSDQCPMPFNYAKDCIFAYKIEQPYEEVDECCNES